MVGEERLMKGSDGEPKGKRPLGKLRCRWEDNIKIYIQYVGCGDMDWIELVQMGTGGGHL